MTIVSSLLIFVSFIWFYKAIVDFLEKGEGGLICLVPVLLFAIAIVFLLKGIVEFRKWTIRE